MTEWCLHIYWRVKNGTHELMNESSHQIVWKCYWCFFFVCVGVNLRECTVILLSLHTPIKQFCWSEVEGGNLNYRNCKSSIKSGLRKSLMLPIWLKLYGRCIFSYVIIFTMLINRFEVSYKSRTRTWLQTLCQSNVLAAFLTGGSILNQADELDIKKRMKETRTNQLITRDK